jgi:hypothetical protein
MGANRPKTPALISMRGPPMRSSTKAETCSSVRRIALGRSARPSFTPDIPIAVGTQAGYSTWT